MWWWVKSFNMRTLNNSIIEIVIRCLFHPVNTNFTPSENPFLPAFTEPLHTIPTSSHYLVFRHHHNNTKITQRIMEPLNEDAAAPDEEMPPRISFGKPLLRIHMMIIENAARCSCEI
jgi:hypothetical protein